MSVSASDTSDLLGRRSGWSWLGGGRGVAVEPGVRVPGARLAGAEWGGRFDHARGGVRPPAAGEDRLAVGRHALPPPGRCAEPEELFGPEYGVGCEPGGEEFAILVSGELSLVVRQGSEERLFCIIEHYCGGARTSLPPKSPPPHARAATERLDRVSYRAADEFVVGMVVVDGGGDEPRDFDARQDVRQTLRQTRFGPAGLVRITQRERWVEGRERHVKSDHGLLEFAVTPSVIVWAHERYREHFSTLVCGARGVESTTRAEHLVIGVRADCDHSLGSRARSRHATCACGRALMPCSSSARGIEDTYRAGSRSPAAAN